MNKPKYLIIKNDLKEKIINKVYPVDSKIPSEMNLSDQYDVSRHTIRLAISQLVNEGYLFKVQGSGNFVSDQYLKDANKTNNSNNTIGIITTYLSDYIFPSIIRGIEKELKIHNYSLMIASTQNNVENERDSLENMLQNDVAGLIVEPTKSNQINPNMNYYLDILQDNIPILMLHASYEDLSIPYIGMDDIGAGEMATQHLIDLGHKRIAIIAKTDDMQGKNRFKGYLKALNKKNMTYQHNNVLLFDTESRKDIRQSIHKILISDEPPTAFVCYNDEIAMEVVKEVEHLGLKVPHDISIVSHDDSFLSTSISGINLTSIEHPKEAMGKEAAKWLINRIENPDIINKPIIYPPKLIVRDSTKKYNSR